MPFHVTIGLRKLRIRSIVRIDMIRLLIVVRI